MGIFFLMTNIFMKISFVSAYQRITGFCVEQDNNTNSDNASYQNVLWLKFKDFQGQKWTKENFKDFQNSRVFICSQTLSQGYTGQCKENLAV